MNSKEYINNYSSDRLERLSLLMDKDKDTLISSAIDALCARIAGEYKGKFANEARCEGTPVESIDTLFDKFILKLGDRNYLIKVHRTKVHYTQIFDVTNKGPVQLNDMEIIELYYKFLD